MNHHRRRAVAIWLSILDPELYRYPLPGTYRVDPRADGLWYWSRGFGIPDEQISITRAVGLQEGRQ